jgi:nucleotide-binding universal stress UspA family protein
VHVYCKFGHSHRQLHNIFLFKYLPLYLSTIVNSTTRYTVVKGLPEVEIVQSLKKELPNTLVVLGGYQRGVISRWFRQSMANMLLKQVNLPLFIASN